MAQQGGERPQQVIGFAEPAPAVRPWAAVALAGAGLVVAVTGFAVTVHQLAALRGEVQRVAALDGEVRRLAGTVEAARQTAERAAAADAHAFDLLAKAGPSAVPAPPAGLAREGAFVAVDRVAVSRHGRWWRAQPVARNDGGTPTRDLQYASASGLSPQDASTPRLLPAAIAGHQALALPGPVLTPHDQGRTFYLHGVIYYRDIMSGMQHVTRYCWYATLPHRFGARPQFAPCVHLNCADRECAERSGQ